MSGERPLILFIDAYDSFSNNIISLLETILDVSVRTIKIDDPLLAAASGSWDELRYYAAIVCGPGPGHPDKAEDVGIMERIWDVEVPVLGICLGFQSLCRRYGGEVGILKGPQHGIIRKVTHIGELGKRGGSIFDGVGEIQATHYQSLCADIGHGSISRETFQEKKWEETRQCPELVPLAWAEWDGNEDNEFGMKDEKILLAVRHIYKPYWALQYHPESICTNNESHKVIQKWFTQAQNWNREHGRVVAAEPPGKGPMIGKAVVRESLLGQQERLSSHYSTLSVKNGGLSSSEQSRLDEVLKLHLDDVYQCHTVKLPDYMNVPDILEKLQDPQREQIILDSSNSHELSAEVRGRYSIIALNVEDTLKYLYTTGVEDGNSMVATYVQKTGGCQSTSLNTRSFGGIWPFLAHFLERRQIANGNPESPFWGGFMGYTTYEMGVEGIDVKSKSRATYHSRPDLCLAWVTRSLILDHEKGLIYVQDLSPKLPDGRPPEWIGTIILQLSALSAPKYHVDTMLSSIVIEENAASSRSSMSQVRASASSDSLACPSLAESAESSPERASVQSTVISIKTPNSADYESKVRTCQAYISSGDSYELCLTDQTTVKRHRFDKPWQDPTTHRSNKKHYWASESTDGDAWSLYRTLRSRQPAPFASFIRLGAATLISSSPERFLKWSAAGECELRPMKGTVRKTAAVSTLAQARALLEVPKEKAENLMIVDLVRHDLHGVCGSGNVSVPRLMVVEEYKSVFQMVSIVRGHIPPSQGICDAETGQWSRDLSTRRTGLDVLAASLPPGSMTGAPKKRSCEILQEIEGGERGLYSGVAGYMDVGGRGDWSVTIRSMFRWDDEDEEDGESERGSGSVGGFVETWHIGAGGAVTTLSTAEGEREEMLTKLNGTLGIFR